MFVLFYLCFQVRMLILRSAFDPKTHPTGQFIIRDYGLLNEIKMRGMGNNFSRYTCKTIGSPDFNWPMARLKSSLLLIGSRLIISIMSLALRRASSATLPESTRNTDTPCLT